MTHLSLQLGRALVVPFGTWRRPMRGGQAWRLHALCEAAARRDGKRSARRRRRAVSRRSGAAARSGRDHPRVPAMRLVIAPTLICALLAAGCAGVNPVPTTVATAGMPNPEEALRQSMQ